MVTVTAVSEDTDGEGASVAIFTVTDLPERPYFMEASYLRNLSLEHEEITGMQWTNLKEVVNNELYTIIKIRPLAASLNSALPLQTVSWSA